MCVCVCVVYIYSVLHRQDGLSEPNLAYLAESVSQEYHQYPITIVLQRGQLPNRIASRSLLIRNAFVVTVMMTLRCLNNEQWKDVMNTFVSLRDAGSNPISFNESVSEQTVRSLSIFESGRRCYTICNQKCHPKFETVLLSVGGIKFHIASSDLSW